MSMNLIYSFREGFVGLRRARLASLLTISTVAVTLTLLGIFLVLTFNIQRVVEHFKSRMALEVFLDNSLRNDEIKKLEERLRKVEGVDTVVFISRQEALEQFRREFGKDPLDLLGENPLPPSFQIKCKQEFRSHQGIETVARDIEKIEGVDEVVYRGQLFRIVDRYSRIVLLTDAILLCVVFLSAVLLVANTLRLTILSQMKTIHIMELVGATKRFIRRPYTIQGVLQGGIGGTIGSLVVWGFEEGIRLRFPQLLEVFPLLILSPLLLGFLLGFLGSQLGLRRFLKV